MKDNGLFLAIDANAIIHRAFHAFPETMVTSDGLQVNAAFGFASMLLKVLSEFDPQYVVCAFDTPKPTFRHTQFPEYKAHRKPTDKSLISQFPMVEELLNAFNIPIIKKEGFEADDILGTLSKYVDGGVWTDYGLDMIIVTGDRDLLQLVNGHVKVCLPVGSFKNLAVYDRESVHEKYGYYPEQVAEYKGMVGDASDNIPGVKGIGDKSALNLLAKYDNLDGVYKNLTELPPRQRALLGEGVEQAYLSRDLATIVRDVDISIKLDAAVVKDFERTLVLNLFKKFQFRSLIDKIPQSNEVESRDDTGQLGLFSAPSSSLSTTEVLEGEGSIINEVLPKVELISLEEYEKAIKSDDFEGRLLLICTEGQDSTSGVEFFVMGFVDNSGKLFQVEESLPRSEMIKCFTGSLNRETYIYGLGCVFTGVRAEVADGFDNMLDIKLLAHMVSAGRSGYSFSDIIYEYTGVSLSKKLSFSEGGQYLALMVKVIDQICEKLEELVKDERVNDFYSRIRSDLVNGGLSIKTLSGMESKTSYVLSVMEDRGLRLDYKELYGLKQEVGDGIARLTQEIYDSVGHEFNINSPKQLSEVLYDELLLPSGRGKAGRTTKESTLKQLRALHPCVSMILDYRELNKLQGTYIQPFIDTVKPLYDKGELPVIKTRFNQIGASSGRFSSYDPNMQNIPVRGEWATKFREVFIPRDGMKMVSIDYSQIEFRVMAHVSGDEMLAENFIKGRDIHLETAARLFKKEPDYITSDERSFGKTVNFGVLYGQTRYGLSGMLGISHSEAQMYIDNYFDSYKGVAGYISKATQFAQENGYVQTLLGRRRYIAGLNSSNRNVREASIREATNMPIQGGAADIMKLALIAVYDEIQAKYSKDAYLLLQVHDELVFEVNDGKVDEFIKDIKVVMESVVELKVPLVVSASMGNTMAELK